MLFGPDPNAPSSSESVLDPGPTSELEKDSQGGGEAWLSSNEVPKSGPKWEEVVQRHDVTPWQIRRAAWLVRRYAEFREMVARRAPCFFWVFHPAHYGLGKSWHLKLDGMGPCACFSTVGKSTETLYSVKDADRSSGCSTLPGYPFQLPTPSQHQHRKHCMSRS